MNTPVSNSSGSLLWQRSPAPLLLYVVPEDWYFLSHRLPMARAARDAGFDVHVATRVVDGGEAIVAEGFVLHAIPFTRGKLSLMGALSTIRALRRLHCEINPAICHHVSLQSSILGLLAASGRPTACVNALTGLGYTFASSTAKTSILRSILGGMLRFLIRPAKRIVLVQNPSDRDDVITLGIDPDRVALIPGSGVDVDGLQPLPEPGGPPTIAFVGRLLKDKGIRTLIDAHCLLRRHGSNVELLIAGTLDPANPTSVSEQQIKSWSRLPGVSCLGHIADISGLWAKAHIAVLPSRREGLPKSLLEAAACGRPMIATDVPGCREIAIDGLTGALVPVSDPAALAAAIKTLANSATLRARYGAAARELAVAKFSDETIGRQIVELYHALMSPSTLARTEQMDSAR